MRWLQPATIVRARFYRPVIFALVLMLTPKLPLLLPLALLPSATAQTVCIPGPTRLIQSCGTAQSALENSTLDAYLQAHGIPLTDKPMIFQYGKRELRNELRSFIFLRILQIIRSTSRTPAEQQIYDWFLDRVWNNERAQYRAAIDDYMNWVRDPCRWRIDQDVAAQYGLTYDYSPFCTPQTILAVFANNPQVPTRSYYIAAALKKSYTQPFVATGTEHTFVDSAARMGVAVGIAAGAGAVIAGSWIAVTVAIPAIAKFLFPFAIKAGIVSAQFATVLGPAVIVVLAIIIGIIAYLQALDASKVQQELADFTNYANTILAASPDLLAMASDNQGLFKLSSSMFSATVPEYESSATPPAHGAADYNFVVTPSGQPAQPASTAFSYRDWDGVPWSATTTGAWLVHTKSGYSTFTPTFRFLDWNGVKMFATRMGAHFRVTKAEPLSGDINCPADSLLGYSQPANLGVCRSVVLQSVNLKDGAGNNVTVRMAEAPKITSLDRVTFTNGTPKVFEVQATGAPTPIVNVVGAPSGVTVTQPGPGRALLSFSGTGINNTHLATVTATNAQGTATQTLQIVIGNSLRITSPSSTTFTLFQHNSFRITTAGSPPVAISLDLSLPPGMTFTDHGDGTATIEGTPSEMVLFGFCFSPSRPCGIFASNAVSSIGQAFTYQTVFPPFPTMAPVETTFGAGVENEVLLFSSANQPQVKFSLPCPVPPWLSLTDRGDGTALLRGTPPANTTGPVGILVFLSFAQDTFNTPVCFTVSNPSGPNPVATPIANFNINIVPSPAFTSSNTMFGLTGTLNVFPIATNQNTGSISAAGTIVPGMNLQDFGNASAELRGNPLAGSGGYYPLNLRLTQNSQQVATQLLNWHILQAPSIQSQDAVLFHIGWANNFAVHTSGYPKIPVEDIPSQWGAGMRLSITGALPNGVTFNSKSPTGANTGTGIFSGVPAPGTEGAYPITISAINGSPPTATKPLTLIVTRAGDVNSDTTVDCADVTAVRAGINTRRGFANYAFRADVNNDGVVDIRDLSLVASRLPTGTRCQ